MFSYEFHQFFSFNNNNNFSWNLEYLISFPELLFISPFLDWFTSGFIRKDSQTSFMTVEYLKNVTL